MGSPLKFQLFKFRKPGKRKALANWKNLAERANEETGAAHQMEIPLDFLKPCSNCCS